eukprot:TRINITY_DN1648_c0_g2_i1.p1 TRINITY_DN1648_c0_g2~~TRINITY_DN1648_c0_g2_i1.p1  ORF type:complete len:222 (+),score=27.57 TRINITY_DN1648_c0_g2_i1:1138-1803(+)
MLINDANCHPFQYKHFMFMHNGQISGFKLIKRKLLAFLHEDLFNSIQGTTDSEHAFMLYLQILIHDKNSNYKLGQVSPASFEDQGYSPKQLRRAMLKCIQMISEWTTQAGAEQPSYLNFAVTDGKTVVATRFINDDASEPASLYYASGTRFEGTLDGKYTMVQAKRQLCYILASEPLSHGDHNWVPVPKNHMIVITPNSSLLLYPIPSTSKDNHKIGIVYK